MPIHLSAYDDVKTAARVAGLLREAGLPPRTMRLHVSKALTDHHALTQFDEQATGGLTANLLGLFDDIFEWGSLPIDTSSYAATVRRGGAVLGIETDSADEQALARRVLSSAPAADLDSGWIGRDAAEQAGATTDDASPPQSLGAAVVTPVTAAAEQHDREQLLKRANDTTPQPGSCFADAGAARRAVAMALPMIDAAVTDRQICGAGFLYIVVMDPALTPERSDFDSAVLYEHAVGDRRRWDADYAAFARSKARLSWRLQRDSHVAHACRAHALTDGETLLAGGVCLDGITVGVSGAEAAFDIAFATVIAANLRALAAHALAAALKAGHSAAGGSAQHAG